MEQPKTQTVYDLFNSDRVQFVVPVYQRAYIWNEEDNWSVLWEDIAEVAQRHLEYPRADSPQHHFLGPIVLDQQPSAVGGLDRRLVIDGQQRLTTLQVLLAAVKAEFEGLDATSDAEELESLVANRGKAANGNGRYKVWPSRRDQTAFCAAMDGTIADKSPLATAKSYFRRRAKEWITREGEAKTDEYPVRIETLRESLDSLLYVVSINLDSSDNAQVIFETLNARGTGLGALDLVKNAALLAAERQQVDTPGLAGAQELNDRHWEPTFEADEYWHEEARQGRVKRGRSDWFLMHWLGMHLGRVVRVDRLFDTFHKEVLRPDPPMSELIPTLCADARIMRGFDRFEDGTFDKLFFDRLDALDNTTMLPLALLLHRSPEVTAERRRTALAALESWLVRRGILRLQSRDYNRLLSRLITSVKKDLEHADEVVVTELRSSEARTAVWPSDASIRKQLVEADLYGYVGQARVRMLLEACERDMRDPAKTEKLALPPDLNIEHAMPRRWHDTWPLPLAVSADQAKIDRDAHINRLGNLTLVTRPLNTALSNSSWMPAVEGAPSKREALREASVLLLNQRLVQHDVWDEAAIDARGADLAERVLRTWPGPSADIWPNPLHE